MATNYLEKKGKEARDANVNKNESTRFIVRDEEGFILDNSKGYTNTENGKYDENGLDAKKQNKDAISVSDHSNDSASILTALEYGGNNFDKAERIKQLNYVSKNSGIHFNSYSKGNPYIKNDESSKEIDYDTIKDTAKIY